MPAGPICIKPAGGSGCLPIAPSSKRIDLVKPSFANPTSVTNPLHPSSRIAQVIYGGQVEGKPFRTEFTLLPAIKTISWDGRQIKTITWLYLAYLDGRVTEVATDWFGQADDGSVWYFGEDVFDYEDGVVSSTEGTWLAGKDGPPAMIMPADPKVGAVYRSENIPGVALEQITVKAIGQTVPGPSGPVSGALVVTELHMDGTREDKVFAPGYGEFSTGSPNGDLEAAALAVPTDTRPGPPPAALAALSATVRKAFDAVGRNDWAGAAAATAAVKKAWDGHRSGGVPAMLDKQMSRDVGTLASAVAARDVTEAHQAALRVAQDDLDLRLRHQPVTAIDRARLDLWARQILVDAADDDPGAVAGAVTTLGWTWDRVRHTADPAGGGRFDAQLRGVRSAAEKKDVAATARATPALLATISALKIG